MCKANSQLSSVSTDLCFKLKVYILCSFLTHPDSPEYGLGVGSPDDGTTGFCDDQEAQDVRSLVRKHLERQRFGDVN